MQFLLSLLFAIADFLTPIPNPVLPVIAHRPISSFTIDSVRTGAAIDLDREEELFYAQHPELAPGYIPPEPIVEPAPEPIVETPIEPTPEPAPELPPEPVIPPPLVRYPPGEPRDFVPEIINGFTKIKPIVETLDHIAYRNVFQDEKTGALLMSETTKEDYDRLAEPNAVNPSLDGYVWLKSEGGVSVMATTTAILKDNEFYEVGNEVLYKEVGKAPVLAPQLP